MFTGIVEELGAVESFEGSRLHVACRNVSADTEVGDSIAVNGVCLTVVEAGPGGLAFDVSQETFARTSLHRLEAGRAVNLERPVTLTTRLGGHIVQGHVDGVGEIIGSDPDGAGGTRVRVRLPQDLVRYVVEKGSITLDGVSLTVATRDATEITVALIPHTLAMTTFGQTGSGDPVNVEVDVIAKYVERLIGGVE